eukprot:1186741-Prorocentrum_minimum.AAC.5
MSGSGDSQAPKQSDKPERPISVPKPHRCNDRLEDVIEVGPPVGSHILTCWLALVICFKQTIVICLGFWPRFPLQSQHRLASSRSHGRVISVVIDTDNDCKTHGLVLGNT